ncbi:helix-turn-helix domain-containing protein [Eudoraea adriatica]|uniref:helix-turn-helix domain-containing protein n=1 Tax=Eudoraea adriatica TaxID=446681 RepID=UPI000374B5DB|nr:hypothetical protein [Eudoraea adriatica]
MNFSKITAFIYFSIVLSTYAQDTIFRQSHNFGQYVNNISTDGNNLFLRIGDSIYDYRNGRLNYLEPGALRFSIINKNYVGNGFFWSHGMQILDEYRVSETLVRDILPGRYNALITKARIDNTLYLCYNGNVLEYHINMLTNLKYKGKSVRHIYSDDGLRIISTYSGVFGGELIAHDKFDGKKIGAYSNGEFVRVGSNYFLCRDNQLFKYDRATNKLDIFKIFPLSNEIIQLIEFGDNIFIIFHNGVAIFNLETKEASTFLIEDEITRAISIDSELITISRTGAIYRISNQLNIKKIQTNYSFEDIEIVNDDILIGGKSGLFILSEDEVKQISNSTEFYELLDFKGNLIFSNFQGLYAWVNSLKIPIVSKTEFNRHALNYDKELLYAGSINGLYVISANSLEAWLNNHYNLQIVDYKKNQNGLNPYIYGILILLVIMTSIILFRQKYYAKQEPNNLFRQNEISIENLKTIIKENNILSVEQLSNHIKISRVQLNRKLSKKGKTTLEVLIDCKKETAIEMYQNGLSIKDISKRVGYSERYIKEKFLNKSKTI